MKKFIAVVLCVALAFAAVGCSKKETPEQQEKRLTQKFADAKYMDAQLKLTMDVDVPSAGKQTMTIDSSVKTDMSGEFPKMSFDGTMGIENMMTLPLQFYLDENALTMTLMGQTQAVPFPEEAKAQLKQSMSQSTNMNANLSRTVENSEYNGEKALKINYDLNQINSLVSAALAAQPTAGTTNTTLTKMDAYYVLEGNDNVKAVIVDMTLANGDQNINMHMEMTINSIGQPIEITAPETTSTTQPTTQAAA